MNKYEEEECFSEKSSGKIIIKVERWHYFGGLQQVSPEGGVYTHTYILCIYISKMYVCVYIYRMCVCIECMYTCVYIGCIHTHPTGSVFLENSD